MSEVIPIVEQPTRLTARALIVGERIDTAGLERPDTISLLPLAFRVGAHGLVALFRFGVAVMVGLTPLEEEDTLLKLQTRVRGERAKQQRQNDQQRPHDDPSRFSSGSSSLSTASAVSGPTKRLRIMPLASST